MTPLSFPTKTFFEADAHADLAAYRGERILFITSKHGLHASPAAQRVVEIAQDGNTVAAFNGVLPDPPLSVVAKAAEAICENNPTLIVALGGGSALDAAKAAKVEAASAAPLIAIPTTSGTGSEINDLAVLTDDETGLKRPTLHPGYQPEKAYLIAELTVTMPQSATIDTGMDVLTHALEAYVAKPLAPVFTGHNAFTDSMAEKATELVFENLPRVHKDPDDLPARRGMLHASALASMAFIKAGLGGVHGISHSTGARLGLVHGRVNSLLLPHLVQFNSGLGPYKSTGNEKTADRYATLAARVLRTEHAGAEKLVDLLRDLTGSLGVEERFTQLGVPEAVYTKTVPVITETAVLDPCSKTNPRPLGEPEVAGILANLT